MIPYPGLMASHGRYTILGKLADGGMAEIFLAIQHGAEGFEKPIVLKRILTPVLGRSAVPQHAARRGSHLDEPPAQQHRAGAGPRGRGRALLPGARAGRRLGPRADPAARPRGGDGLAGGAQRSTSAPASAARSPTRTPRPATASRWASSTATSARTTSSISDQGEVKLTDFGIAKAQRKREQTAAGVIKGKVAYMSPEQAIGGVDRQALRHLLGRLDAVPDGDGPAAVRGRQRHGVAAARSRRREFEPPEKVKPTVGPAVSSHHHARDAARARASATRPPTRCWPTSSASLRNEFHSAGQTELKLWLEQLARRDGVAVDRQAALWTRAASSRTCSRPICRRARRSSSTISTRPRRQTEFAPHERDPARRRRQARSRSGARPARSRRPAAAARRRRRSGFWLGVVFALAAVVGIRYLVDLGGPQGRASATLGLGGGGHRDAAAAAPRRRRGGTARSVATPTAAGASAPAGGCRPARRRRRPPRRVAAATGARRRSPDAHAPGDKAARADRARTGSRTGDCQRQGQDRRQGGRRGARRGGAAARRGSQRRERGHRRGRGRGAGEAGAAKAGRQAARDAARRRPKGARPRSETAVLHLTSAPAGAIVQTKARVLGRTPINLHFKTGNTYELEVRQARLQADDPPRGGDRGRRSARSR